MKSSECIKKYNDILEGILIKYLFAEDINDILYQAMRKYEELERLSESNNIISDVVGSNRKKYKKNEKLNRLFDDEIESYTDNLELINALQDFKEMRNNIGKPFKTVNAITRLFNKLDKYSNNNDNLKIEILEKSILNNWQDIWELKRDDKNSQETRYSKKHGCTYANTPTLRGEELEDYILGKNDLDKF